MDELRTILSPVQLRKLRDAYRSDDLRAILEGSLPAIYERSLPYVRAIADAFYGTLPDDSPSVLRDALSAADRERCLIALLASRREELELALHMYVGLMEGVSQEEIAHVLFLAGIYTGADNFAKGLFTEVAMLQTLASMVAAGEPVDARSVVAHLKEKIEGRAPASGS